jgi:hypothetical protein
LLLAHRCEIGGILRRQTAVIRGQVLVSCSGRQEVNAWRHDAIEHGRESMDFVFRVDDFDGERQVFRRPPDLGGVGAA